MLRIGLVGGAKAYHGMTFAEIFNNYDMDAARALNWSPLYDTRIQSDARITCVWDENEAHARELAQVAHIDRVCARMEDMLDSVDGVLVVDDVTMQHQKRAIPFLKAGLPVFIDKPISTDLREAEGLFEIAEQHRAPLMSCSALRFAAETRDLRTGSPIGTIVAGSCAGMSILNSVAYYGIHPLELLLSIVGNDIDSISYRGSEAEGTFLLHMRDNRCFSILSYEPLSRLPGSGFHLNLYGTQGEFNRIVNDSNAYYTHMLDAVVEMMRTGVPAVSPQETLTVIRVLGEVMRK